MWPNNHPPSRASPGDHFNNNPSVTNPYSRNASTPKAKPGQQSPDPWNWGVEDSSTQQDDWNSGWNQNQASVPNVIPNSSHLVYHPPKPEKKAHGTPDLIPDKINNTRGNMMKMGHPHYNQVSNASDFFENIDLAGQNHQISPLPTTYNISDPRRLSQQPNSVMAGTLYPGFQQLPPQSTANQINSTHAPYFSQPQPQPSRPVINNPMAYYQQPSPVQTQNMFQIPHFYQPEGNTQLPSQEQVNYYNQSATTPPEHSHYSQSTLINNSEQSHESVINSNTVEVENIEIAPPEQTVPASSNQSDISRALLSKHTFEAKLENSLTVTNENNIPDNQETVPDNEEHVQNLPEKLSQMKIGGSKLETWSSSAGWENLEVAPRCELDRNQYLETGQFTESTEAEEVPPEAETHEEAEALPPPGLHRMVTGQGTESLSLRSVLGQPPSISQNSGFSRLVHGQPTPSASPEPMTMERLVPGQQNNEDINMRSSHRMVPGHQSQDLQRFSTQQDPQDSTIQRLFTGQTQNHSPVGVRMVPGQLSDDENNISTSDMERMIPVGVSEHESSFPGDVPDDERMVPGGMSDDSRSQSISIDDEMRNSSERMVPGMTEPHSSQSSNQTERLVTGAGGIEALNPSSSSQDGPRHTHGSRSETSDSITQPPVGLHRLVLGQMNNEASGNSEHTTAKSTDGLEEKKGGNPPPGMHRMVVGQFREEEPEPENSKEKEPTRSNDREDDSDSDNRSYRRRHRHRRESYDEERKERDYSSEREYRGKREDRRDYKKKRDNSFNRSPEYRSDHEDYDRNDYRDRRDRERRDRPRDRDRRRRSPDYSSYDPYYRDDPRKLHPRDRDRRYYEPYEDDPYYYRENRSRPSSRSGSDYRRHREYPPRQPYYPEQGGVGNYMHYYQMQQYYENMRRTDPQAYALWYERYMAEKFGTASNDRASVHSGRSSANDNSQLQENDEEDGEGVKAEDAVSHRSTPPLYTSAHIRGQFNMLGQLIVVNPHDPFSYGEHHNTVTLCKVAGPNVADSPETLEFLQNPGPFVSGVTHKNTVLQYLKKQSDQISHSSGKLLYELIRLVIKLNGVVDMTDVADLLMESYRKTKTEENDFRETSPAIDETPLLSPHEITSKFRDLLLEGNKTEALEWAMKHKDWGHALFLASKMDSRTHNNVMLRFANGLQNNDPLQTLYQLMSGREPQAATCAADKKWGDWRPHLAMMLSNQTSSLELDRKAILTLGDSLGSRGRLFASHFCYLTAQLEFSNFSDRQAKLVLLGASLDKPFSHFATCRAIMLTLCYEYAKQLSNKEWCIPTLRPYKFMLACQLFDHGNLTAALAYLEWLAQDIVRLPHREDKSLIQLIIAMADKIKCVDTTLAYTTDPSNDPEWLAQLKYHVEETNDPNYLSKHLTHGISTSTVSDLEPYSAGDSFPQPLVQDGSLPYQPEKNSYPTTEPHINGFSQNSFYDHTQSQNSYYNPQHSMHSQEIQQIQGYSAEQHTTVDNSSLDYWSANANTAWEHQQQLVDSSNIEQPNESAPVDPQPQISVKPGFGYYATSEENNKPQVENQVTSIPPKKTEIQEKSTRRVNKTQQSGPGWFGGIWDKLALRPKNQMKLPDDKNPAIVWDEKTKKWVNTDSSEEEQSAQLKPPPKASELSCATVTAAIPSLPPTPSTAPTATGPTGLPPQAPTTNKYKLQRGKGMRANYVDVMGTNSKSASSSSNPPQAYAPMPQAPVNFFVPASVPGNENAPVDFLSPSGPVSYEPASSKPDDQPSTGGYGKAKPSFFNPSSHQS